MTQTRELVEAFHRLYAEQQWPNISWLGVPVQQYPTDLLIYGEILWGTRPELIIELGTGNGGSALYFAAICQLMSCGRVVSVDAHDYGPPGHPLIRYMFGSSTSPAMVAALTAEAAECRRVMVLLDSDHTAGHVLQELDAYAPLVTPGCYLIVEDTCINGHPLLRDFGPGPQEALAEWLPRHPEFEPDRERERLLLTQHPGGWLRRRPL